GEDPVDKHAGSESSQHLGQPVVRQFPQRHPSSHDHGESHGRVQMSTGKMSSAVDGRRYPYSPHIRATCRSPEWAEKSTVTATEAIPKNTSIKVPSNSPVKP